MIAETTINLYPIFKFILYLLAVFGGFYLLNTVAHLLSNKHTTDKFLEKYPNVSELFINKTEKEQNIENNQEIWEHEKRLKKQEKEITELKRIVTQLLEIVEKQQNG